MKFHMIFILILLPIISAAQEEIPYEEMCDMEASDSTDILTDAFSYSGGRFITSSGVVRALVVFAKMQDDSSTSSNGWPLGQDPSWYQNYIDSTTSSDGTFTNTNLSHYFYEMSGGQFQLIGDVYPHIYRTEVPSLPCDLTV